MTIGSASSVTTSAGLWARALDLFPGGVNSPVRAYRAVGGDPPIIVRGQGSRIWDADGQAYLDLVGAFGPMILGHADPAVTRALTAQIGLGGPFGATTPGEIELGEAIRSAMPSVERLRFVSSGTEAVMSALRVARAATGRDLILKFAGGYHGHADSLLAEAGSGLATLSLPASAGVTPEVAGQTIVAPYNDLDAVARRFRELGRPDRGGHRRAGRGQHGRRPAGARVSRGSSRAHGERRQPADLRRGHHRLPGRAGRCAGPVRDPAGSHDPRQDHRWRPADRGLRRPGRPDGARRAGRPRVPGRHAVGPSAGDGRRPRDAGFAHGGAPMPSWSAWAEPSSSG